MNSIGRQNRARIVKDRYEPYSNPPVYKSSLYDDDNNDSPTTKAPPPLPQLVYSSPFEKRQTHVSKSSLLIRDFHPEVLRSPEKKSSLPAIVPPPPPPLPMITTPKSPSPPTTYGKQAVVPTPSYHSSTPVKLRSTTNNTTTIDTLVKRALSLQEDGFYDDAHELLLQVEMLRLQGGGGGKSLPASARKVVHEEESISQMDGSMTFERKLQQPVDPLVSEHREQKPLVIEQKPLVIEQKPLVVEQKPLVVQQKPLVVEQKPLVVEQKPVVVEQKPVVVEQKPVVVEQKPLIVEQKPLIVEQKPVVVEQQKPVVVEQKPVVVEQKPLVSEQRPLVAEQKSTLIVESVPKKSTNNSAKELEQQLVEPNPASTSFPRRASLVLNEIKLEIQQARENPLSSDSEEEEEEIYTKQSESNPQTTVSAHGITSGSQIQSTKDRLKHVYLLQHQISFSDQIDKGEFTTEPLAVNPEETVAAMEQLKHQDDAGDEHDWTMSTLPGLNPQLLMQQQPTTQSSKSFIHKEGFLLKLKESPLLVNRILSSFRNNNSMVHKRFFRLSGGVFLHLKSHESKIPKGMVRLDPHTVVEFLSCEGIQFGYCIAIKAEGRNYTLFPETKEDAVEWVVALKNNIDVLNEAQQETAKREAFRRSTQDSYKLNASFSFILPETVENLVGKDVTKSNFRDLNQKDGNDDDDDNDQENVKNPSFGALYQDLGVSPSASAATVKKSYYRLAKLYHPDKQASDPHFAQEFARINLAFHTLFDPEQRARYDLGERVKFALRRGVQVTCLETDSGSFQAALYLGPTFQFLYYQEAQYGPVLRESFQFIELRFVQEIIAGEDCENWPSMDGKKGVQIMGQRLGKPIIRFELDTVESRNEILDGLRILRSDQSVLFGQTLTTWLKDKRHR